MIYSPKVHFENAKALSVNEEDRYLRYCCLELRFCIEAITYQKLSAFDNIPNTIIETWQPYKAMKMLAKLDEFADKTCAVEINLCSSDVPPIDGWIPLGKQKIPSVRWLTKNYNKLGYFLHLPTPKDHNSSSTNMIRECVVELLHEIEKYLDGGIWIRATGVELLSCLECSEDLIFNRHQVKDGDVVECDACKFVYQVKSKGGSNFQLSYKVYDVKCGQCKEMFVVNAQQLMKLREFVCTSCGQRHAVAQQYHYFTER